MDVAEAILSGMRRGNPQSRRRLIETPVFLAAVTNQTVFP
jgi:queuine/archaeosine tRNA-ribosyltransferase